MPPQAIIPKAVPVNKSWTLAGLRGTREDMVSAVQSAATVPDAAKAFLVEGINALPARAALVAVDAHGRFINDMVVLNVTIKPL